MLTCLLNTVRVAALGLTLYFTACAFATPARAQSQGPSEASAVSAYSVGVPLMMSVAVTGAVLEDGLELALAGVEASADGTSWLLEGASDGARVVLASVHDVATLSVVGVGTVMTVVTIHGGWLLVHGATPVALVPDRTGVALLHHERIGR